MQQLRLVLLLLACITSCLLDARPSSSSTSSELESICSHLFPSGNRWDLAALAKLYPPFAPAAVLTKFDITLSAWYLWSPCNTLPSSACPGANPRASWMQIIGQENNAPCHNTGSGPNATWVEVVPGSTIQLIFDHGDSSGGYPRGSQITIRCDPKSPSNTTMEVDGEDGNPEHPPLHYNFKWRSSASWACPQ